MSTSFPADPTLWLPHRAPFLLLSAVTALVPGVRAEATWTLRADEPFFAGHFPGQPVVPGVLLIESMAQCGAVAVMADDRYAHRLALFGGIDRARFRRQVLPGDTVTLTCEIAQLSARGGKGHGTARVGEQVVAEADVLFVVVDRA